MVARAKDRRISTRDLVALFRNRRQVGQKCTDSFFVAVALQSIGEKRGRCRSISAACDRGKEQQRTDKIEARVAHMLVDVRARVQDILHNAEAESGRELAHQGKSSGYQGGAETRSPYSGV